MKTTVALILLTSLLVSTAQAQSPGERIAKNACIQCHTFGKGEPPGAGPNLFGLIGRKAGSQQGFAYSAGFTKALEGKTWDRALLERWLTDTQALAPGSGMVYFQDDPKQRAALIQYLASLK